MPEISCTVRNCVYWKKGNRCQAETVSVGIKPDSNTILERENYNPDDFEEKDEEFADEIPPKKNLLHSYCLTMKPR
ncbi:MAG: DUF1540 domain-containing protein [Halanaerobiales bacterium]